LILFILNKFIFDKDVYKVNLEQQISVLEILWHCDTEDWKFLNCKISYLKL